MIHQTKRIIVMGLFLAAINPVRAAVVFSDDFSTSTINGASIPTPTATSYDIASSKNASGSSIIASDLKLTIPATSSGFVQAQARFASTAVNLGSIGDSIRLTATFTDTANILSGGSGTGSYVCFGLYNSGGVAPLTGLANTGLTTATASPNATGGVQLWQGFVSRITYNTFNSSIVSRPQQTGALTTSENQDLIGNNWGGGAYKNPTGATLGSAVSAVALTDGQQYTLDYTLTLTAGSTLKIDSSLYSGVGTGGLNLFTQTATATGANFLTASFDGLALGYRYNGTSAASAMDINSIQVTAEIAAVPEPTAMALASLGLLGLSVLRRRK